MNSDAIIMSLLFVQLYLGCWQFTSSAISVIARAPHFKAKRTHLIVSSIYLLSLFILGSFIDDLNIRSSFFAIYMTVPAWILGIYYYVITWRWTLPKKTGGGKFLPHINF
jgi:hypothetical protein